MDLAEILGATFVIVCGIVFLIGVYKLTKSIVLLIVAALVAPFMISNQKKTNLHYYDHPDRYFDFQTGHWIQKQ